MFIDVGTNSVTGKHYIVNTNYIESMVVHEDGLTLVMSSGDKGHLDAKQSEVLRQAISSYQRLYGHFRPNPKVVPSEVTYIDPELFEKQVREFEAKFG